MLPVQSKRDRHRKCGQCYNWLNICLLLAEGKKHAEVKKKEKPDVEIGRAEQPADSQHIDCL